MPDRVRGSSSDGWRLALAGLVLSIAACAHALVPLDPVLAQGRTAARVGDDLPKRVAIRFLTDNDFPPFNYLDEEGQLVGFNVDLARAICLELAMTCDVQPRAWAGLLPALAKGQADAVIAGHTPTPGSLAYADFTDAYLHTPARFVARRGNGELRVAPDGLSGKSIGVARGTAHEAYLRTFFHDSVIRTFENQELARDALIAGEVDLIFDDGISLVFWLNGTLSKECCELKGGPFFETRFFGDGMAVAVAKTDAQLKSLINRALRQIQASGRFDELILRYFPSRVY
jgi:polar amino acid transport system substrate-binding protein